MLLQGDRGDKEAKKEAEAPPPPQSVDAAAQRPPSVLLREAVARRAVGFLSKFFRSGGGLTGHSEGVQRLQVCVPAFSAADTSGFTFSLPGTMLLPSTLCIV